MSVSPGDDRLKEGRMTITLEDPQKEIRILSTKRAQGTPSYFGSFELSEESDGLLLINELDVEDYLTRVVPSEMPSNYELEALKAQAVCARTYLEFLVTEPRVFSTIPATQLYAGAVRYVNTAPQRIGARIFTILRVPADTTSQCWMLNQSSMQTAITKTAVIPI